MDIVGYARIAKNATTIKGAKQPETFAGEICAVFEFNPEGDVLVINPEGNAMAMVDAKDVQQKFTCSIFANFICPPNLDYTEKIKYATKCNLRKGGYSPILFKMIVMQSLHKGTFTDNLLWAKQ